MTTDTGRIGAIGFRIPRSKTTRYLQSFISTAIRTHNSQAGRSRQHASTGDGGAGTTKGGSNMEECLGVNVRPVVRVDCNLEE